MSKTIGTLIVLICCLFASAQPSKIVVAKDGSGDYATVQAAINAVPSNNKKPVDIFIKKGIYKEVITVEAGKNFISITGEDKDNTILTYDNHSGTVTASGDTLNTRNCASFFLYANDFHAEHISFQNNAGFNAGQAVAMRIEGTRASFKDCKFLGFQDVLFLSGNAVQHYFDQCYIEGTTDFIFGAATAVFNKCHIHSKKNSHVTAASTAADVPYGFVFLDCKLTADTNVDKVSLGRPWRPAASVTYINCWLGKHIIPEGWNNWKNPANEATARYAEYNSSGPGANAAARATWSRQLPAEEAKTYTLKNIFGDWKADRSEL